MASAAQKPALLFGDSITSGFWGVFFHSVYGPRLPPRPKAAGPGAAGPPSYHPYGLRLSERLGGGRLEVAPSPDVAGLVRCQNAAVEVRSFPGWPAERLLAPLQDALREGDYRCAVVLAGSNDIVFGGSPEDALESVERLHAACEAAGLRVLVLLPPDCDTAEFGAIIPAEAAASRKAALAQVSCSRVGLRGAASMRYTRLAIFEMPNAWPSPAAQLSDLIAARCREMGRPFVDLRRLLSMGEADLWDDCIHPSPLGSDKIGDAVFEAMLSSSL